MKTLFGRSKLTTLGAISIVAILTVVVFAQTPAVKKTPPPPNEASSGFVLKIKGHEVPVKSEKAFKALLCNGHYDSHTSMHMKHADSTEEDFPPCSPATQLDIKTDNVIASETAKREAAGEYTLIQVHVTQQVCSQTQADIQAVLDQLQ